MDCKTKQLILANKVKQNLSSINNSSGYIAGWEKDDEIFCMTISATMDYFIPGLEEIGFFCFVDQEGRSENDLLKICEQTFGLLQLNLESAVVLFAQKKENTERSIDIFSKIYSPYYGTLVDLSVEIIDYNPAVLIRAQGQIPLVLEVPADPDTLKENIELAIEKLRAIFQSRVVAFLSQKSKYILHSLKNQTIDSELTCKDFLKLIADADLNEKSKSKKAFKRKCPVIFDILLQTTGDSALESTFNHSVVIHSQRREFKCATLPIPLDVVVITHESSSTYDIQNVLQSALDQQLTKISSCLLKYAKTLEVVTPVPYHFYPDFWEFPVTVIYPLSKIDDELETYRRELHKLFLLPLDRPFLRKLNAHDFSTASSSGHLINPHEGVSSSGVVGGKSALVQGRYSYHHYMQDRINDDGWGCAYRSLQTIISWFKFQGYTDKSIPSHTEIQEALVEIGDKPQSFVNSWKWIGSQEVSFCLDQLIQVQSKIMFVSSGAEMASKGRELYNHFIDQGTPIMIGGGVLAHTILGVDFNQETGELKFLILDPHYTGSEDLNTILNKGWCGWKGTQFWSQTAFYNLCLPQRPLQI